MILQLKTGVKLKRHIHLGQIAYQEIYLGRYSDALNNITQAMKLPGDNTMTRKNTWDLTVYATAGKKQAAHFGDAQSHDGAPDASNK